MSRTYRKANKHNKCVSKKGRVRDGTFTRVSGSCENHGGCPICEGNKLHKYKKKMQDTVLDLTFA